MATRAEVLQKLETMLAELDDTLASGVKSAFSDGERIENQTTGDMIKARAEIVRQIDKLRGGQRQRFRPYRYYPRMRF